MTIAQNKQFRLTGWHVLVMIVLFFVIIASVNAVMITLAVKSFPGEQQKKSYMQGLEYNEVLAAREEQAALGWRVTMLDGEELPAGDTVVRLRVADRAGLPVRGLVLTGMIGRPATDREDREISFVESGDGIYTASVTGLTQGIWDLQATSTDNAGTELTMEKRLWLK